MHSVPATAQASIPIKIMMMPNATDFLHKPQAGSRCDPGQ